MRNDLFDYAGLTPGQRAWRIAVLLALIAVLMLDLFVWRPN